MERNPKTGRFLPGNRIALGNHGNRNPKWGNKNAKKHGLYENFALAKVRDDGFLYIYTSRKGTVKIAPEGFIQDENGRIAIRDDIAPLLEKMGINLE